ncbi:MAG: acyl-CoA thioesterase [Candidatus Kapabacteria bacterium]|nr:acyl-CoA thioesterase [Candidatus Kapabacteria bacterium]
MIRHSHDIRVRYADTDKMGVVYNGNYLTYFEIGRTELLRSVGLAYAHLEAHGLLLPVREAHVTYLMPAYYDDVLSIETTYEHVPNVAVITLSYRVLRQDDVLATGYTKHSFVHAHTWRPTRPPRVFVDAVTSGQIV